MPATCIQALMLPFFNFLTVLLLNLVHYTINTKLNRYPLILNYMLCPTVQLKNGQYPSHFLAFDQISARRQFHLA